MIGESKQVSGEYKLAGAAQTLPTKQPSKRGESLVLPDTNAPSVQEDRSQVSKQSGGNDTFARSQDESSISVIIETPPNKNAPVDGHSSAEVTFQVKKASTTTNEIKPKEVQSPVKTDGPTPISSVIERSVGLEEDAVKELIETYREQWLDQDEERMIEIVEQMQADFLEVIVHEHLEPRTDDLQEGIDA